MSVLRELRIALVVLLVSYTGWSQAKLTPVPTNHPTLVSAVVQPQNASHKVGERLQYAFILTFSDGSTRNMTGNAWFRSGNPYIATVEGHGTVTLHAVGTTTIGVRSGPYSGATNITVTK